MDRLIYNLIRGIAPGINELDPALKNEVLANPYFMIGDDGSLSFSPVACMVLTNHLYMEIKKLAVYQTVTQIDQIAVTAEVMKLNEEIINQKIKDAIANTLISIGIDPLLFKGRIDDMAVDSVDVEKNETCGIDLENQDVVTDESGVSVWNKIG